MATPLQEIYTQIISTLSPSERLRLATLILNDLVPSNSQEVEFSDTWTEEDQQDLIAFSLQSAATRDLENEELTE